MHNHGCSSRLGAALLGAGLCLALAPLPSAAEPGAQTPERRPTVYVGVAVDPVDPTLHRQLPALNGAGVTVRAVEPGSAAARAGLRRHDVLLQWEDQRLFTPGQLRALLRTLEPGQSQVVTILRQGAQEQRELVLGTQEARTDATREIRVVSVPFANWQARTDLTAVLAEILHPGPPVDDPPDAPFVYEPEQLLGFKSRAADAALAEQLGLGNQAGPVIETVHAGSPAARAGLEPGDLVVGLQAQSITTTEQFTEQLGGYPTGSLLTFGVWRGGNTTNLQMTLPAPLPAGQAETRRPLEPPGAGDSDWLYEVGDPVEWMILLEGRSSASPLPAGSSTSPAPEPASPAELFGPAPGLGTFALADGRGSIEVQQRGGRDHVIVRNIQGSILYEGPMNSEADRLWLRPLNPALRQAAEDFAGSDPAPAALGGVRVWRWTLPPRYL
jgi:hypothetical protein